MRTAYLLTMVCVILGGGCVWPGGLTQGEGGVWPRRGVWPGGVPCDLSHHEFDVTCMLPPHQLRPTSSAAAYILLVGHVTCKACWDTHPLWTEFLTHAYENITVTGGQPLKLAHSLLGYAVGMTDINRPGWPITRKQTHRNKF